MPVSKGRGTVSLPEIKDKVSEAGILSYYLGIRKIPCLINSPLRADTKPSFGLYSTDGKTVHFKDFSTGEGGGVFDLLSRLWRMSFMDVLSRIEGDIPKMTKNINVNSSSESVIVKKMAEYDDTVSIQCKVREWKEHDIEYWESYGVSLKWLKYAEVYPISHKFIIKGKDSYMFSADKHAYAFVERKEGNVTLKIYQPFNKKGFKWCNKHDRSVIGLWTKVPEKGDYICICSSLKDALCLWSNAGIPSVYIQGEGYSISETAMKELKRRFKSVFICLDNDEPGRLNSARLARETGFHEVIIPEFREGKDLSDFYKAEGKDKFISMCRSVFPKINRQDKYNSDLPFQDSEENKIS